MTHVSKRKIGYQIERQIVDAFMSALFSTSLARGKARVRSILTSTERIMLAKRLAIITMLERDQSYYRIEQTLNVSGSTIGRLHKRLVAGDFDPLCRVFGRNLSFLNYLEIFLSAGMPSIGGPRHQKRLDQLRTGVNPRRSK
ncbi:MAG: Trp family transcriptional regulator [Patescibacteria group bacterium]